MAEIQGWMSPEELRWLTEVTLYHQYVVEFGSWVGRSTAALAQYAARVWACDHWAGDRHPNGIHDRMIGGGLDVQAEFRRNLASEIFREIVVPVTVDLRAEDALATIKAAMAGDAWASLVFIDANHVKPHPALDIKLAMELVGPLGVIAGHDYDPRGWPDVVEAVEAAFPGKVKRGPHTIWWAEAREYVDA